MSHALIVGVMGGGDVSPQVEQEAHRLGALIAQQGWILLNGGRNAGVMAASARGASEQGGITIGVLPDADASQASPHIQFPICTGMGSARNAINVLSSNVVVACPGGPGTISEIALALKHEKTVITMGFKPGDLFVDYTARGRLITVENAGEAVREIRKVIDR